MATAIMLVTDEFMREVFELPSDTTFKTDERGCVEIEVTHPDIPEGTQFVTPRYFKQKQVVFAGWDPRDEG